MRSFDKMAAAIAFFCLAGPAAFAQVPAGRIEPDTRPVPEPTRRDALRIPQQGFAENVPDGAQAQRFTLAGVQLAGNRAMGTTELQPLWAGSVGRSISLADAFAIAAAIGARYRAEGFVLSQAIIPPQELDQTAPAMLRIEVLEGYVEQVRLVGFSSPALVERLSGLSSERPLRLQTLERALLLANELAGVHVEANLKAGTAPNSSELQIVATQVPRTSSVLVHNRTAPAQGRLRIEAGSEFNGVLGAFDRHGIRLLSSGDRRLNLLDYHGEAPIGLDGGKANWGASWSKSQPDAPLPNIDSESRSLSLGLSYPLLRTRREGLVLRGTLHAYENRAAEGLLQRDAIRALRVGVTLDLADDWDGLNLVDLEASAGLDGLGASAADDPRLNGARPDFRRVTLYVARLQSLGGAWSLLAAATAQHAGARMPAAEQLGLGGDAFVRGFDPSEAIGESGFAAKLELRFNARLGAFSTTWYAFRDAGRVERRQVSGPTAATALASFGAGVRFGGPGGTKGYLEVAQPQEKDVSSQGNRKARAFAGLGIEF